MKRQSLFQIKGSNDKPLPILPDTVTDLYILAAGVERVVAVPDWASFVLFGADAKFYAAPDRTAVVSGDVTDGTAPLVAPVGLEVDGVANINLYSADGADVNLYWFKR